MKHLDRENPLEDLARSSLDAPTAQLLRHLLDNAPECIYVKDLEGRHVLINHAFEQLWDRSRVIGKTVHDFMPPPAAEACTHHDQLVLDSSVPMQFEEVVPHDDGPHTYISTKFALRDAAGTPFAIAGISTDITDREKTEKALRESEERFRLLVESIEDYAIFMVDAEGCVCSWNPGAERIMGYPAQEVIRQHFWIFYTDSDRAEGKPERDLETAARLGRYREEGVRLRKNGSELLGDVLITAVRGDDGALQAFAVVLHDVTERRRSAQEQAVIEAKLHRSERLESIGQLAGGIAHDFSNLFGAILNYTELLQEQVAHDPQAFEDIKGIAKAAQQGSALTRRLLLFGAQDDLNLQPIDLNATIQDLYPLLRRTIGSTIEIDMRLDPDLLLVQADPGRVEEILLNLALNARDAMPYGGSMTIETGRESVRQRETRARQPQGSERETYVYMRVNDSGLGMDEQTRVRAFEPFFTTKPKGVGTGLGLPSVYGVARQMRGDVVLESEVGQGTSVTVRLPAE